MYTDLFSCTLALVGVGVGWGGEVYTYLFSCTTTRVGAGVGYIYLFSGGGGVGWGGVYRPI